jgi:hypothetical protein
MPFDQKSDLKSGVLVDFDQIYNNAIKPAIEQCGLEPLRGDEESPGGIIHSAMFARLMLSEFVVADLTLANANVFYELGVRHAAKPFTTVAILANVSTLSDYSVPFLFIVSSETLTNPAFDGRWRKSRDFIAFRICDIGAIRGS